MRAATLLVLLLLTACATVRQSVVSQALPPLPDSSAMPCCWQVQERIHLQYAGSEQEFLSALSIDTDKQIFVLVDPLGTKVVQSQRQGQQISVQQDISEGKIPVNLLWTMINLLRTPTAAWPLADTAWQLTQAEHSKVLQFKGADWMRAQFIAAQNHWQVHFVPQNSTLTVSVLKERKL